MSQNRKSPYQEGRDAYAARTAEVPHPKNPYAEFSEEWGEWNRGYNSCWMKADSDSHSIVLYDGLGSFTVNLKGEY